jgi:hypothetical protein
VSSHPAGKGWEIDMTMAGLLTRHDLPYGREAQSRAFFSTPGMPWLYSGVTMTTPSLLPIDFRRPSTCAGAAAPSSSSL